jgi:single-stranded DNA-binding protein
MNSCSFTGHLTRDAEIRNVGEKEVAAFGIAVNGRKEEDVMFLNCDLWEPGKVFDYLTKGKLVGVSGELKQRRVEKDGEKREYWSLNVRNLALLGGSGEEKPARKAAKKSRLEEPDDDGNLPF